MTSEPICEVYGCDDIAKWKVENVGTTAAPGTGKIWRMCDRHVKGYNRQPMIVTGRI